MPTIAYGLNNTSVRTVGVVFCMPPHYGVPDDGSLQPGETLYCHFTLPYTQWAPAEFALTFHPPSDFSDLDNSNNAATVVLHRAAVPAASATPVPTLSPLALSLLAALLAMSVACFRARSG